jgi:hypothetical protein
VRFEDGRTERIVDRTRLPSPVYPGLYSSTAQLTADSEFAEDEAGPRWG